MSDVAGLEPVLLLEGALVAAVVLLVALVAAALPEGALAPFVFLLDEQLEMTTSTEHAETASSHWRLVGVTFIAKPS